MQVLSMLLRRMPTPWCTACQQATARRVEAWARTRLRQAGLPQPERVFMVSAANGFGIKEMLEQLKNDMGFRADLWVVGAQNGEHGSFVLWLSCSCQGLH
jgi:hypothetical protein